MRAGAKRRTKTSSLRIDRQSSFESAMVSFVKSSALVACLIAVHFLSDHEVLGSSGLKRTVGEGLSHGTFVRHPSHYLNVDKIGSYLAHGVLDCGRACVHQLPCVSFNVAAQPDVSGHLVCELLASDKYNSSDQFHENPFFHHYSIDVSFFY